ncbi:MAG TPA: hypothetical protein VE954_07125 [Oligoflexus sp.]|uniref:hypothetical protein n=1 Tax=Oligoflexus sp. TaxID=1971216 RepID=UPI002D3412AE|nr:hypothetical protein [Oligoflexus sp.]HYX32869.1 hypothetical protein [Oligoflexus sp.]
MKIVGSQGFSMVGVLMALGLSGLVGLIVSKQTVNSLKGQKLAEYKADLSLIKSIVLSNLDCESIFSKNDLTPANITGKCVSTSNIGEQIGPNLRLFRRTMDGKPFEFGQLDAASGTIKLGNWSLKATCSAKEQSLIIRAAILDAKGNFVKDPLTGRAYDFEHPNSLLIGGGKAVPLCFSDPGAGQFAKNSALESCLSQAAGHPFTASSPFSVMNVSSSGSGNSSYVDTNKTDSPTLVLVQGSSSGSGGLDLRLENPNAYYCLDIKSSGSGGINVKYNPSARVLQGRQTSSGSGGMNISAL